jgi:hypothetical protein
MTEKNSLGLYIQQCIHHRKTQEKFAPVTNHAKRFHPMDEKIEIPLANYQEQNSK